MELLTDKVIYHVETQEDYNDLMERLEKLGYKWWYGGVCTSENCFPKHGENTAIRVIDKKINFGHLSHYLDNLNNKYENYQIIKYKNEQNPIKVKLKASEKFIVDWYEKHKVDFDDNLYTLIGFYFNGDVYGNYDDLYSWMVDTDDCIQTLVKMHLFGYEIEKEPLYYVAIPNPNSAAEVKDYHLAKTTDGRVVIQKRNTTEIKENWKLTENEIKKDFEWAWDFAKEVE